MKPIKLKELLKAAKDPDTQQIAIAENYTLYDMLSHCLMA